MVQGSRKGKPVKDDYLLRYQVGITPAGCSTDGGQSQGSKGIQKGKQVGEKESRAFLSGFINGQVVAGQL